MYPPSPATSNALVEQAKGNARSAYSRQHRRAVHVAPRARCATVPLGLRLARLAQWLRVARVEVRAAVAQRRYVIHLAHRLATVRAKRMQLQVPAPISPPRFAVPSPRRAWASISHCAASDRSRAGDGSVLLQPLPLSSPHRAHAKSREITQRVPCGTFKHAKSRACLGHA